LAVTVTLGCLGAPVHGTHARSGEDHQVSTRGFYLDLIRQARSDGRPRAALAFLDDFDRQYASDVEAIVLRINCLLDLGELDKADAATRRLPRDARASRLGADGARGHVSAALERWSAAVVHYKAAIAARPADANLFNALGYAQIRAGQARDAIATLRSASELSPKSDVIRNNLLLALLLAGEADVLRDALDQIPDPAQRSALDEQLRQEGERVVQEIAARSQSDETGETQS
jgi:tetratricopeptide (TPR) repeat protein